MFGKKNYISINKKAKGNGFLSYIKKKYLFSKSNTIDMFKKKE